MRNVFATALAVPVLAGVIGRSLVSRAGARRLFVLAIVLAVGAIVAFPGTRPAPTAATPPSRATAIDPTEFTTEILTSESPVAPVTISFAAAMNAASVESMIRVTPATDVTFGWDDTATRLIIRPATIWRTGTFYSITVLPGALDADGRPLERRLRAAFNTRPPVAATLAATNLAGNEATAATTFRITFDGPVDASTVGLDVEPALAGRLVPAADAVPDAPAFEFVPDAPLRGDTAYRVALAAGVLDAEGVEVGGQALQIRTAAAPAVVRFRPANRSAGVAWSQNLSVRFTEPMDRSTTEAAWSATQGAVAIAGSFSWAENDTVLIFDPKVVLGYSQSVTIAIGTGATSKAGLPVRAASSVSFTTAARPVPPKPPSTSGGTSGGTAGGTSGGTSGGSLGSGTWGAVETYYLKLMNCNRGGGLVTSSGGCTASGGQVVPPLVQDAGISATVSRPYAKKLALSNLCTHFSGGTPADRLKAAGYTSYIWAENLGCRSGEPYASVLGTHLFYQSERSYSGGHWVNLMNTKYDRVGIGVWAASGRVRLVVDFYRPR
ncbi:MAG: Ig-like domain-containing protein [Chloroflexi bacterium]|nr:Ig-like domain-containing protein [Chloroflexota bacterium]